MLELAVNYYFTRINSLSGFGLCTSVDILRRETAHVVTYHLFLTDPDSIGIEDRLIGCLTFMKLSRYCMNVCVCVCVCVCVRACVRACVCVHE